VSQWFGKNLVNVINHPSLAIAIRHKYLNVYSNGQSIFRVRQRNGFLVAKTHFKYLPDRARPEYRSFVDGTFDTQGLGFIEKYEGESTLDLLVKNANVYAGAKKKDVHSIIKNNGNVIDTEIAFTTLLERKSEEQAEEETEKARVDRIDIVALEENPRRSVSIVFYEVKTFDDPRIRAEEKAEVLGKLDDYQHTIMQAQSSIITAYRRVCRDLVHLQRPVGKPGKVAPVVEKACCEDVILTVDPKPRLVIVGYDRDQWSGPTWQEHCKKLAAHLGNGRVLGWGEAAKVRLEPNAGQRC
jgi:hypothetical protein